MTLDRLAWFIGEVARPISIMAGCIGATAASIIMASKVTDGNDGYLLAGAIWLGAGALFVGKAVEVYKRDRNAADVEIARSTASSPTPQPVEVVNSPSNPVHVDTTEGD